MAIDYTAQLSWIIISFCSSWLNSWQWGLPLFLPPSGSLGSVFTPLHNWQLVYASILWAVNSSPSLFLYCQFCGLENMSWETVTLIVTQKNTGSENKITRWILLSSQRKTSMWLHCIHISCHFLDKRLWGFGGLFHRKTMKREILKWVLLP